VPLPSLAGQFRRLMSGGADGPGVTAGSASGTSSLPAQEEGDGTADASTGVPASMVGQQRYGDRHCADGQQGAGEMPEQESGPAGAVVVINDECQYLRPLSAGSRRGSERHDKPSVRALISHVGQRAVYRSPGLTVSLSAVSAIVGSAMVKKVARTCYLISSRFRHGAVNDLGEADHETLPATSGGSA
jgi:hypothetical protein